MIGKVVGNSQWLPLPERNKPQDLPASAKNFWEGLLPRLSGPRSTEDSIISERQHSHGALQSAKTIHFGWGSITGLWWIVSQHHKYSFSFIMACSWVLTLDSRYCICVVSQPRPTFEAEENLRINRMCVNHTVANLFWCTFRTNHLTYFSYTRNKKNPYLFYLKIHQGLKPSVNLIILT